MNRVAELNLGIKPALNIMDGTKSFVFGGPSHGDVEEPKLIVASRDRIAADATGVAVLKSRRHRVRLQKHRCGITRSSSTASRSAWASTR